MFIVKIKSSVFYFKKKNSTNKNNDNLNRLWVNTLQETKPAIYVDQNNRLEKFKYDNNFINLR